MLGSVELSHTHVFVKSDQNGMTYDVAIDNIFASGYDSAGESVPFPLNNIKVGDHLDLCGKPYPNGKGIDWVHTDCGDTPTPARPNGWLKIISPDASIGDNLENSTEHCSVFAN